jgi:hypothetical protein
MSKEQAAFEDQWLDVVVEASEYLECMETLMSEEYLPLRDKESCVLWIVGAIQQTDAISPIVGNLPEGLRERLIWSFVFTAALDCRESPQKFNGPLPSSEKNSMQIQ